MSALQFLSVWFHVALLFNHHTSTWAHQKSFMSHGFEFLLNDDDVNDLESSNSTLVSNATALTQATNLTTTSPSTSIITAKTTTVEPSETSTSEERDNTTTVLTTDLTTTPPTTSITTAKTTTVAPTETSTSKESDNTTVLTTNLTTTSPTTSIITAKTTTLASTETSTSEERDNTTVLITTTESEVEGNQTSGSLNISVTPETKSNDSSSELPPTQSTAVQPKSETTPLQVSSKAPVSTQSVPGTSAQIATTAKDIGKDIKERIEKGEVTAIVLLTLAVMVVLAVFVGIGVCYKNRKAKRKNTLFDDAYNFGDKSQEIHREMRQGGAFHKIEEESVVQMEELTEISSTSPVAGPSTTQ